MDSQKRNFQKNKIRSEVIKTPIVIGSVVNRENQRPLAGLRVEAWVINLLKDVLLGCASTDTNGMFTLTFDDKIYQEYISDWRTGIDFKVFLERNEIYSTKGNDFSNIKNADDEISLRIDLEKLKPDVIEDIKSLQRITFIAPDLDAAFKLLDKGIRSASQAAAMPEHIFISQYGSCFANINEAKKTYDKAVEVEACSGPQKLDSSLREG